MAPPSWSNDGLLALVSCLSGGYKFPSVLRCMGLVCHDSFLSQKALIKCVPRNIAVNIFKYLCTVYFVYGQKKTD